jgi:cytoskeletal protein CcmA (bactofilin family)
MRAEINNCSKIEISGYLEGSVMAVEVIVREGAYLKGHIPNSQCP